MLLVALILGAGFAFLMKKIRSGHYTKDTRRDIFIFCLSQISGNIMLLLFRQELQYIIASILICLVSFIVLKNISFPMIYMLAGVSCVAIILCCTKLLNINIELVYGFLRVFCTIGNILISADIILFLLSGKLKKHAESCHLFRQSLVMIICFVIFIMPSNLNFVNSSGYTYDYDYMLFEKKSENSEPVPISDDTDDNQNMLLLDKNQILTENADYCYAYLTESLSEYNETHLNCHEFKTWYLNDKIYENQILNSVIELTKTYQINPSYLFTYILKYNSEKSKEIPATASDMTDFNFVMDFNAWNREELQADAYTSGIYNELMKNFSMLPEENKTFPLSHDANPFYTYFAYCDEQSVYFVTLYLTLDETNQITEADYTMLQFIDFNQETEQLIMKDYATELEAIYDTAFGNEFVKDSGRYDMILTQENDTVYFRRYYCNYTR